MHLSKSADNTHRINCEPTKRPGAAYAVCLNVISLSLRKTVNGETLLGPDRFKDCQGCIKDRSCPAIGMLREEKKAGKALYYVPYVHVEAQARPTLEDKRLEEDRRNVDTQSEGYQRGWNAKPFISGSKPTKPTQNKQTTKTDKKSELTQFNPAQIIEATQL
jgi:hypothetical protein